MEVKVLGNIAVVQGSDTEKSSMSGKDTSGKYAWMDVFVKRGGKCGRALSSCQGEVSSSAKLAALSAV